MNIGQALQKFEKQRLVAKDALETLQKSAGTMNSMGPVGPIMQEKYTESKELAEIALWALREVERLQSNERRLWKMLGDTMALLEESERKSGHEMV